jgi:poly(3-hydroxybutyrate) depolymerase
MRSIVKALCFSLLVSRVTAKCKKPLPAGQEVGRTNNVTIRSGGTDRYYLATFPVEFNCEKPTPVILSYHGAQQDAARQLELSQMSNPFFNDFAIVVYPQGLDVR